MNPAAGHDGIRLTGGYVFGNLVEQLDVGGLLLGSLVVLTARAASSVITTLTTRRLTLISMSVRWVMAACIGKEVGHTAAVGIEISVDQLDGLALGRAATGPELASLEEHGFVVVPALLPEGTVEALQTEFERLVAEDPRSTVHELGTRRSQAKNDNNVFSVCWRHRVVLDAAVHVLGPTFQVGGVDLRDPDPGHGEQRFHPDHGPTPVPGITATWLLDAFTADNGATRVLPGSHLVPPANSVVTEAGLYTIPGSEAPTAGEVLTDGPPGSLLVRHARLFHAGGRNTTKASRRSALVFFQHHIPEPES